MWWVTQIVQSLQHYIQPLHVEEVYAYTCYTLKYMTVCILPTRVWLWGGVEASALWCYASK